MAVARATPMQDEQVLRPVRRHAFLREILHRKIATLSVAYLLIFYSVGILAPLVAPSSIRMLAIEKSMGGAQSNQNERQILFDRPVGQSGTG